MKYYTFLTVFLLVGIFSFGNTVYGSVSMNDAKDSPEHIAHSRKIHNERIIKKEIYEKERLRKGFVVIDEIRPYKVRVNSFVAIHARGLQKDTPVDIFVNGHIIKEKLYPSSDEWIAFNMPKTMQSWAPCLAWDNANGVRCALGQVISDIPKDKKVNVTIRNSAGFSDPWKVRLVKNESYSR